MVSKKRSDGRAKKRPGIDAQRRRIIEEATRLFAAEGSRNVSISQLCDAAAISRPTFYRCFTDKDALIEALYREAVQDPVESIMLAALAAHGASGRGWLRQAIDEMLDAIFARADVAALLFVDSSDPASPAHAIIQRTFDATSEQLRAAMARAGLAALHPVTRKAMLVACQWVVHDAIQKGLTPEARAAAKEATWEIATRVFAGGAVSG